MMQSNNNLWKDEAMLRLSLQFFAEGAGDGGAGAADSGDTGSGTPAGGNDSGASATTGEAQTEQDFYEKFSEGERNAFLKKHGLMHHNAARARYQGSVDKAAKYDAMSSHLGAVAERYGVSVDDPEGLAKAILNDPVRIKAKADEMGVSEEIAKSLVAADAQNAIQKAQMAERVRAEEYTRMQTQETEVKAVYPSFDLSKAGQNPAFKALIDSGKFTMKEAYEMAFARELNAAAMEAAKNEARAAALAEYQANGGRPKEGTAGQAGSSDVDPGKLTGKALDEFLASFLTH